MTDDLVKQALAELGDVVRCRCHEAFRDRGLHDPQCQCDSMDAVKVVTARIEELERERREAALDALAAMGQAQGAYEAQLKAEATVATLTAQMEALRGAVLNLPAVYAHQINTGVREVYDPLQRFFTLESVLAAITTENQNG
jgi:hypothetical protein